MCWLAVQANLVDVRRISIRILDPDLYYTFRTPKFKRLYPPILFILIAAHVSVSSPRPSHVLLLQHHRP